MKLKEIYQLAVEMGKKADPRGKKAVERELEQAKKAFEETKEEDREGFDQETLANPYADTRILLGSGEEKIGGLIVGVDMEVGEVLLADRLRDKGEQVDLIMSHHPEGKALASLSDVMKMQADIWGSHGVPINVGDALIGARMREVSRGLMPGNHQRAVDAARLLGFPFISVHTPADNLVTQFLTERYEKNPPYLLKDIVKDLKEIEEYKAALAQGAGPSILVGDGNSRAGKVAVDMTGGTGGPKEAIEKLAQAGVGTLIGMHMSEKNKEEAEKHKMNVVIAGHIASDSLGMNLFLDQLEKKDVAVHPCSGLIRVKRSV